LPAKLSTGCARAGEAAARAATKANVVATNGALMRIYAPRKLISPARRYWLGHGRPA